MTYVVVGYNPFQIWQFDHVEDAVSKMAEIATVSDGLQLIQSQLETLGRYAINEGDHWAELYRRA